MSKDNQPNNLRLLGSPVNLFYRKKKDDKKNRIRPHSAFQHSYFKSDTQERHRRPFSADAKEHVPSTRTFLKSYSAELMEPYSNSSLNVVQISAPTTELLRDVNSHGSRAQSRDRDLCSNASDHGSEDTYISLGTKIKARAQSPKAKNSNSKNFIKYRNLIKKNKRPSDNQNDNNLFKVEVTFEQKDNEDNTRNKNLYEERTPSPCFKSSYQSFFLPLNNENNVHEESLSGRVSFGRSPLHSEVEQAIDTYSRRLNLTKQQLSLVEEESTQGSVHSNRSSLSTEISDELHNKENKDEDTGDTYVVNTKAADSYSKCASQCAGSKTYNSFYEDFQTPCITSYAMSSTGIANDAKDSGYTDSVGTNDEKSDKHSYPNPTKKSNSVTTLHTSQTKSLQSISSNEKNVKSFPIDKNWVESVNHSRLLYKDFFLKKEGHIAKAPQNSPIKSDTECIPGTSQTLNNLKEDDDDKSEYPSYLLNSNTKAYTSKVIEDYKKEIQAINNLHDLTLKDLKTNDVVSPTPLNIDKMFDQHLNTAEETPHNNENLEEASSNEISKMPPPKAEKKPEVASNNNVCDVSTRELIKKYLKVKDGNNKNFKNPVKKVNNLTAKADINTEYKQPWNNKNNQRLTPKNSHSNTNIKNGILQVERKSSNNIPLSARTEDLEHDRDIESWMSMSAPSPRILEIVPPTTSEDSKQSCSKTPIQEDKTETLSDVVNVNPEVKTETKQLDSDATVLDIFSMLKEIESFGDKPVTILPRSDSETPKPETEEKGSGENFTEIFQFLEGVEQSANDALADVTNTPPQNIPRLEALLQLPHLELAQRLVTSLLQLEERSCCIALLQESLANHKEQTINKVNNLEKQANRNICRVKNECEDAIKRHQTFIDQLINDKKTLNHRIEQLVDERRALEEKWRRTAQTLEERYQLQLRNQHDKMQAQQQVARQRWVRQKAEKIKELTVKGLEGELREMAERQQKELSDLQLSHAENIGKLQSKHSADIDELRLNMEAEREAALMKERQLANSRLEKQILELEMSYQAQRTRLVSEMRAENERVASGLCEQEKIRRQEIEKWREEQEKLVEEKKAKAEEEIQRRKEEFEQQIAQQRVELENEFEAYKREFESSQKLTFKMKLMEIQAQHKKERDREIEKAIESMETEAQIGRKELQDALRRNKEQYEAELRELAETEQATLKRYKDAQARVRHTEDKCAELEVSINQLQTRNKVLIEKNLELEQQYEEVKLKSEAKWTEKLDELKKEMEDLKKKHEEQMQQLYAKVKVAVARKDFALQALTKEAAKYQEKITMLEQKLQQQRKDFFKHK